MTVLLPLLIALIGVLMFALAPSEKLQEIGKIMFFCGLLAFLLVGGPQAVSLFQ